MDRSQNPDDDPVGPDPDAPAAPGAGPGPMVESGLTRLPPSLDVLWNGRARGRAAPKPGLSVDAIVSTAIRIADAEGLAGVSMAKVASALGFTTMALYRHVANKDELLVLMWNASAAGAPAITGEGWRERLESWATIQMDVLQRRRWILQMPLAAPPAGPNSLAWVEQAMVAMAETPLGEGEKLGVVGLISTFVLGEGRMANDAAAMAEGAGAPLDYGEVLRLVVDEHALPALHRAAWSGELGPAPAGDGAWASDPLFRFGLERILDGVELLIQRRTASRALIE